MEASDGAEALEVASAYDQPIDLLLTDVIMPKVNGLALARGLLQERPGIRVLYMSGYPAAVLTERTLIEDGDPYIQKPFTPQMLAERIRQALSR